MSDGADGAVKRGRSGEGRSGSTEAANSGGREQQHRKHHRSEMGRPALSAAEKDEKDLSIDCCLRLGVAHNQVHSKPSKEDFLDETDSIGVSGFVEKIVVEDFTPGRDLYYFARIYFNSPENADLAAVELNKPLRKSKWRFTVTQRLPHRGIMAGEMRTIPAFEPFPASVDDVVIVDTQEGYVAINNEDLYWSRSAVDFVDAKAHGRLIRRLVCKHFDPERRLSCRHGTNCSFIHLKSAAMDRILRTAGHKSPLRFANNDDDIQVGTWDFERRNDTLIVRNLADDISLKDLSYMFEGCPGFMRCHLFATRLANLPNSPCTRYGIVRFDSKANAMATMIQTFDSDLNIGFYGVMEDARRLQMRAAREAGVVPTQFDTKQQTHLYVDPTRNTLIASSTTRSSFNSGGGINGPSAFGNGGGFYGNAAHQSHHHQHPHHNHQQHGGSIKGNRPIGYASAEMGGGNPTPSVNVAAAVASVPQQQQPAPRPARYGGPTSVSAAPSAPDTKDAAKDGEREGPSPSKPVPFPELPSGWGYGVSRRNGKYYFFEHGSKEPTTFKHPVTHEKYSSSD